MDSIAFFFLFLRRKKNNHQRRRDVTGGGHFAAGPTQQPPKTERGVSLIYLSTVLVYNQGLLFSSSSCHLVDRFKKNTTENETTPLDKNETHGRQQL